MNNQITAIQKAIEIVGPANLAKVLGVKPQFVTAMGKGERPVPPARCLAIEEATGGRVTRYQLRPDVFGSPPAPGAAA